MCRSVAMDPKYIYLVECTLNTLSIYFSLTFRSHATKPHKLHGCTPHHIIHTMLIEKKINHPKQDLPIFCSYDVVPCTPLNKYTLDPLQRTGTSISIPPI